MKKLLLILSAILLLVSGCGKGFYSSTEISYEDFKAKLESGKVPVVIDIREPAEFDEGYIGMPDENDEYPYPETFTVNIPFRLLESKGGNEKYWDDELWMEKPASTDEILVYSQRGKNSAIAIQILLHLGFENVKSLIGGYRIWLDPDAPLEEAPKSSGGCG